MPQNFNLANEDEKIGYCQRAVDKMISEMSLLNSFIGLVFLTVVGMITSVAQRLTIYKFKDNVTLDLNHIALEVAIVVVNIMFLQALSFPGGTNTIFEDRCGPYVEFTPDQLETCNKG